VTDSSPDRLSPRSLLRARVAAHVTVLEAEPGPYLRLDAAGRWTAYRAGEGIVRRTLDGRVARHVGGRFELLSAERGPAEHGRAYGVLQSLDSAVRERADEDLELLGSRAELAQRLEEALRWTPARMAAHESALREAWPEPTLILPPHRYRDLVVLPAMGCPNHRCGFCAFYRDRPFRVLDDATFEAHLENVAEVLGPARAERDGIFLGSASALSLRDDLIVDRLGRIAARLGTPRRGIASFLDPDRAPARTATAWVRLREAGLVEATIGLETGLPRLRERAGKSADLDALVAGARAMIDGGVRVGLTVLVGLGGPDEEAEHRRATVEVIARIGLRPEDHVHLSPLAADMLPVGESPALEPWREALAGATEARVAPYLVERFAWLA